MDLVERWTIRYYEWSCKQAEEEFRLDFPLLSTVLGATAWELIEYAATLSASEKERLSSALVKRFNTKALSLIGRTIDPQEAKLIDGYLNYDKILDPNGNVRGMRPYGSEKQRVFIEQIDSGSFKRGSRRTIRKIVTKQLGATLGAPLSNRSGEVRYETKANGWRMKTSIDYGGSYGQITQGHVLISEGGQAMFPPISLFGWMGLGGRATWDVFTSGQEEEVAGSIVRLVSWFAERWVPLIEGV